MKDTDNKKRIKKAVKESQLLRDEKKKKMPTNKSKRAYSWVNAPSEQNRGNDKSLHLSTTGFLAGKSYMPRNTRPRCFCCLRRGYFTRECREANATQTFTFNGVQPGTIAQQAASQLMGER